jgi:hypothetical protein
MTILFGYISTDEIEIVGSGNGQEFFKPNSISASIGDAA